MTTIDQVHTTIDAYKGLIERAADEMLKVYSYAPRGFEDLIQGDLSIGNECDMLLRQSALLEPGQSTENRVIQSKTSRIVDSNAKGAVNAHIESLTGAQLIKVTGDSLSYEFKAQAHRTNDGCTIHTAFDAKYGGSERLLLFRPYVGLVKEETIDEHLYSITSRAVDVLLDMTQLSGIEGNQIEFVKKIRDNDLIPGVNLNSLSDEEIEESLKNLGENVQSDTMRFIMQRSGLSDVEFAEKIVRLTGTVAEFDLSQLSFHFEYDIEIDEETFKSYFESDEDSKDKAEAAKTGNSIFTPNVIAQINKFVNSELYEDHITDFDLNDYGEFERAMRDAENGITEFELDLDLEQMEDLDVFESVLAHFFEGYIFSHDFRYMTRLAMKLDKEANTLEVTAYFVLGGWSGPTSNGDEFVVFDGRTMLLEDYVNLIDWDDDEYEDNEENYENHSAEAREDFIDADQFNPSDTAVTTVISLDNQQKVRKKMAETILVMNETAKLEYRTAFDYFLEYHTQFDDRVKEILTEELINMLNANDTYHCPGRIDLDEIDLDDDEKELVESIGAFIDYELFFDDDITLVFGSKLVYQLRTPEADAVVDESNLRRFDVPFGQFSFAYLGEAYEEKDI